MVIQPTVKGEGGSDLMKEVDWAEFSKALSNQSPPHFNTGLIFLQNDSIYNGGIPVIVRADFSYNLSRVNLITMSGNDTLRYDGNSSNITIDKDGSPEVMYYSDVTDSTTPPTFADGWSARYFILNL